MRWLVVVIVLAGCDDVFGLTFVPDAAVPDAPIVPPDAPVACYGRNGPGNTGLFQFCTDSTTPFPVITKVIFNTDQDSDCAPNALAACVIVSPMIAITGTVTAVGSRPLVLISTSTIMVSGTIDVSSNTTAAAQATMKGAGADDPSCTSPAPLLESGGGPGGSFGTAGGAGGGGTSTSAASSTTVTKLRGGCPGSLGTIGENSSSGEGGASGGTVYLIAGASITVTSGALIDASGSPGFGGSHDATDDPFAGGGGGGGGTGGLIGFDAPAVMIDGVVIANGGGGGGGGAGTNPVGDGLTGFAPSPGLPIIAAPGGTGGPGSPAGGNGGAGCANTSAAVAGAGTDAGGGGGGGCGAIRVFSPAMMLGPNLSPPPG